MLWFKKKIKVPETNEVVETDSVQLWEVRWWSRHDPYASGMSPELEAFPTEEEAMKFKTALENAFRLIKHTSGNNVWMGKAK